MKQVKKKNKIPFIRVMQKKRDNRERERATCSSEHQELSPHFALSSIARESKSLTATKLNFISKKKKITPKNRKRTVEQSVTKGVINFQITK